MGHPITPPRELAYVPLAEVADDLTFRLRPPGDVSSLAQSMAQCGQLFPIELRAGPDGRWQPITGFRRLQALRLLHRQRVLARLHPDLPDAQAAMIAAADAIDSRPLEIDDILDLRERYRVMGWITPALEELLARALEKAEERLEDLAARLRGEAPPDRAVPDEDSAPEPGEEPPPVDADPLAVPPAAPALGKPRGAIGAPAPEADATSALGAENAGAVADAERGLAAARDGVEGLLRELEEAAESMDRTAPPSLSRQAATPAAAPKAEPVRAVEAAPAPPVRAPGEEVTLDELAEDLAYRLSAISLDLASLADGWADVPPHLRAIITDQLQYYSQLGAYLDRASGG